MTPTLFVGLPSEAQLTYIGKLHLPIVHAVGSVVNLRDDQITGPRRIQNIVYARSISIHLVRKYTKLSLKQIGKMFGGRNHATVMNALNAFQNMYDTDKSFKEIADKAEEKIIKKANNTSYNTF